MNTQNEDRSEPNLNGRTIPPRPSPEEKHERLEEGPEVIVLRDLEFILVAVLVFPVNADVAKHLHPDDGVDEEEHGDQQTDIR